MSETKPRSRAKAVVVDEVEEVVEVQPAKAEAIRPMNERAIQKRMADRYKAEKLVSISVSPMYAPEFSNNQPVVLNGIRINVPTDGRSYNVPESFAMVINERKMLADEKFKRLNRMSNVRDNFERSPGELDLIR